MATLTEEQKRCRANFMLLIGEAKAHMADAEQGVMNLDKMKDLADRGWQLVKLHNESLEMSLIDIRLMEIIFKTAHLNIDTIAPEKFEFNAMDFARRILNHCDQGTPGGVVGNEQLVQTLASTSANQLCYQAPHMNTMLGVFKTTEPEKKQRLPREKKTKDIIEPVKKPEKVDKIVGRTLEETVKEVERQLEVAYTKNGGNPINYLEFIMNPHSFSSTVENIFHVSFLVNSSLAHIFIVDEGDMPMIVPVTGSKGGAKKKTGKSREDKTALVTSITHEEWKDIIETLKIREPMLKLGDSNGEAAGTSHKRRH